MNARDDYPYSHLHSIMFERWGLMCDEIDRLHAVVAELAALVKDEYPSEYSLAQIVDIWGLGPKPVPAEVLEALRLYELTAHDA